MANEIKYYNRETEQILIEDEFQKGLLEFLYNKTLGRFLLKTIAARPWFSEMLAKGKRKAKSKKEIAPFVEKYNINISPEELDSFNSFNDFFTRKRAPLPQGNSGELVSVADSKFSYFPISDDLVLKIKGSKYTIKDLLDDEMGAEYFRGGTCLVFRLTVDDNHRYNFIDSGKRLSTKKIRGELHTVRPISEKYDVYTRNSREVSILGTEELGIIAQIEVGALLVGRIVNHDKASFVKNEEKGYFEYGGSTIVVLLNKKLEIDPDIAAMNENGIETKVKAGEKLGLILE